MFKKLLIANRGEIAKRILESCLKLNIKPICIYSNADKDMEYLNKAYKSICIGDSSLNESYLNSRKIFSIAEKYNCEAIHPGYGLFSENHIFAMQCKQRKLIFIGPDSNLIQMMGNKIWARRTMHILKIPVVPGSFKEHISDKEILAIANNIGFPLLIKAVAGGGGRGIKFIKNKYDLKENIKKCRFEAQSIFGNNEIYVEKFIDNAKHIEIQIAGDSYGNVVHFHERDCSIQRNNQKLLEETPSPGIDQTKISRLKNLVVLAMKEIKYNNLGTLEFLLDAQNNYYFIEANTRLQVEHPITEFTTGYDLVDLQIKIASGDYLGICQKDVFQNGHSIECRINAENPKENFNPSVGKIQSINFPMKNKHIRIDSHITRGFNISPFYDSMIIKVIVHHKSRHFAINLMKKSLDNMKIKGIFTTINLQISILNTKSFIEGSYTCAFINNNIKDLLEY